MGKIEKGSVRTHSKASEKYIDVVFNYDGKRLATSVPLEYRRTGTMIEDPEVDEYLAEVYDEANPTNWSNWRKEQVRFWSTKPNAGTTKPFFDKLQEDFDWKCVACTLPSNPNWARRIQDIKEFGFTLATRLSTYCPKCKEKTTQLILLPIKRGGINGYETWSLELRSRIVSVLRGYDAFEAKRTTKEGLLPDHKFPEIRWDEATKRESLEMLTDAEILHDFQLLNNQRNQQKREVCRTCYQTGKRGQIFGIEYFSNGTEDWDTTIPTKGKAAERGCIGCPWYDIEAWRKSLQQHIRK